MIFDMLRVAHPQKNILKTLAKLSVHLIISKNVGNRSSYTTSEKMHHSCTLVIPQKRIDNQKMFYYIFHI